jgi:GNAT superfamily N-acetyltransferase
MEYLLINGRKYGFAKNYKENEALRKKYNELTEKTYGFSFEPWYQDGYWGDSHIPYTLFDGDCAVSNLSVNKMKLSIFKEEKNCIQIGTVMTDKAYRNLGLSSYLINRIIEESECDFIYLFANKRVLGFYPKFGFRKHEEYNYFKNINFSKTNTHVKKLDMEIPENKRFLYKKAGESIPLFKVSMLGNPGLVMFHCTSFMKEFVYYIESLDIVVIAEYNGNMLHIYDIFSAKNIKTDHIIKIMCRPETKTVTLGFAPCENSFQSSINSDSDNILFIYSRDKLDFGREKLRFPDLSHT